MKYCIQLFIVLFIWSGVSAQTFNNEWIDYSKTYYKFKVGKTGLYRITQTELAAAGLANISSEQFQLFRNGKEVPLYITVSNGLLTATDHIEFWGEENDGKTDKALYKNPAFQLSDRYSLQTDTAAYFLTVNHGPNLRFVNTPNNVAGTTLTPLSNFMYTLRYDFKNQIHKGRGRYYGVYVYSSAYDEGEGWTSNDIAPGVSFGGNISNFLDRDPSGPPGTLRVGMAGNSKDGFGRSVKVSVNGTKLIEQPLGDFEAKHFSSTVPHSVFNTIPSFNYDITYSSGSGFDRVVVSYIEYKYPKKFDFANASNFEFNLPAAANSTFIQINNFNGGNAGAALYDLTNMQRYSAVYSGGYYKFVLTASTSERRLILVNEDVSNTLKAGTFKKINFTDYSSVANQGDYLFITGRSLLTGSAIQNYKSYRQSTVGGNFKPQIIDADELWDQFAFGIKKHPLSVKNFMGFAKAKFSVPPKFCFLVGKGMSYDEYRKNEASAYADQLNQVPTFGYPASDVILASNDFQPIAATPIGRISVIDNSELLLYLNKVKEYEAQQANISQTVADKSWMKNIAFVAGLNSGGLETTIDSYFAGYKPIAEDSLYGGKITYFSNSTTGPITPAVNQKLLNLFNEGISLFNYFGHSSAINLDYTIDDPSTFKNKGKYPMFLINGCDAGNIFSYDVSRITSISSLAEKFVMAPNSGAIGFIGSSHYGITTYLDKFNEGFYKSLSRKSYNKPVSVNVTDADIYLLSQNLEPETKYLQAAEYILNADPALKINAHSKPDYVIEEPDVKTEPAIISVAEKSFQLKVYLHNIGKFSGDSIRILLKHQLPNGTVVDLFNGKKKSFGHLDSLIIDVPIVASIHKGENKITVTIDPLQQIDELNEINNTINKNFQIIGNDVKPIYPYDLSIVPASPKMFYASTADPFLSLTDFYFELDTTLLFDSPIKFQKTIHTKGGLLEFNYPNELSEGTVYYWRVGLQTPSGIKWNNSSFTYLLNQKGFNQSHFFQHKQSSLNKINLTNAGWKFSTKSNTLRTRLAVFPTSGTLASEFSVLLNGELVTRYFCLNRSVAVNVFDPNTLKPLINQAVPSVQKANGEGGFMGSAATCDAVRQINFEFSVADAASRNKLKDFLDWIPSGYYVVLRNRNDPSTNSYVDEWKNDISVYGAGNSLYDRVKAAGFTGIDKYTYNRVWSFVYKKNDNNFMPAEKFSEGIYDKAINDIEVFSSDSLGEVMSPLIGPATSWNSVQWTGIANSSYNSNNSMMEVYGITSTGTSVLLQQVKPTQTEDVSTVSTNNYPYLQLRLKTSDGKDFLPYQLKYWRVLYTPLAEGAVHPSLDFQLKDTVERGEQLQIVFPFKNVSTEKFDSLQVRLQITDQANQTHTFLLPKTKPLFTSDTARINTTIDTKDFPGNNTLHADVNPDLIHPEQTHVNNFFYRNLFVRNDNVNPLLDVTFDGVHILNNDIVSASPKIKIDVKDDSKYLLLNDTSLVSVKLRYPNSTVRDFNYTNDTLKFIPATGSTNKASVEFSPYLKDDGDYQLTVRAKDKAGNLPASNDYSVSFKVMNKAMISDMFNYPNPFTTSTAFVFTLTGNEVPQNLKIQILTITGKIVKEITKQELGSLHIGKNITEYKWDGTDAYGQPLANGVYLYRVITNLNGNSLERFDMKDSGGNSIDTQKFFNKGYGKMYLMR
jgi:hypothetical protein